MTEFKLMIDTPIGTAFDGDVVSVTVQASDGRMGILAHKAQGIVALSPGMIRLQFADGKVHQGANANGLVVIEENRVHILTEDLLWEEDIDVNRQVQSITLLREQLSHGSDMLHREYVLATAAMARAAARLKAKGVDIGKYK